MIKIRIATEFDASNISHILCESIRHLCILDHHNDENMINAWIQNKSPQNVRLWVTEESNITIVNSCRQNVLNGVCMSSRQGEILLLYVDPQFVNQGIGSNLLSELEIILHGLGIFHVSLDSTQSAFDFYQKKATFGMEKLHNLDCLVPIVWRNFYKFIFE